MRSPFLITEQVMPAAQRRWFTAAFFLCAGAIFALYGHGLNGLDFLDDFISRTVQPRTSVAAHFTLPGLNPIAYRPIEGWLVGVVHADLGDATWPLHAVTWTLHAMMSLLTYLLARRAGITTLGSVLAVVTMVVSQANVSAVEGNDTFSQVSSTLAAYLSLWLLAGALMGAPPREGYLRWGLYAASVLCFFLALILKETAIAFLPLLVVLGLFGSGLAQEQSLRMLVQRASLALPYAAAVGAYLVVRGAVGLQTMRDVHSVFGLGSHVAVNVAFQVATAWMPFSSVDPVLALRAGEVLRVVPAIAVLGLFMLFLLAGAARSGRLGRFVLLGAAAVVTTFPMVLLERATEVYVYNMMPFVSCAVGAAAAGWFEGKPLGRTFRAAVVVALGLVFISHAIAVREKVGMMLDNGNRAAALRPHVVSAAAALPRGGSLILVNPPAARPHYSVYVVHGFDVLAMGQRYLLELAGREDAAIEIVAALPAHSVPASILTLEDERIRPLAPPER